MLISELEITKDLSKWNPIFNGWELSVTPTEEYEETYLEIGSERLEIQVQKYKVQASFNLPAQFDWLHQKNNEADVQRLNFLEYVNATSRAVKIYRFNLGNRLDIKLDENGEIICENLEGFNVKEFEKQLLTFNAFRIPMPTFDIWQIVPESHDRFLSWTGSFSQEEHGRLVETLTLKLKKDYELGCRGIWFEIKKMPNYLLLVKELLNRNKTIDDLVKVDREIFVNGI